MHTHHSMFLSYLDIVILLSQTSEKQAISLGRKSVSIRPSGETLHLLNVWGFYTVPDVLHINNALTQTLFLKL